MSTPAIMNIIAPARTRWGRLQSRFFKFQFQCTYGLGHGAVGHGPWQGLMILQHDLNRAPHHHPEGARKALGNLGASPFYCSCDRTNGDGKTMGIGGLRTLLLAYFQVMETPPPSA